MWCAESALFSMLSQLFCHHVVYHVTTTVLAFDLEARSCRSAGEKLLALEASVIVVRRLKAAV